MEIEIVDRKENKLLNRIEVKFNILHEGEKTPERELVRSNLSSLLKVKKDLVIVDYIKPKFGIQQSAGYAKIYKTIDDAKKIEREHILRRNKVGEKKEEVKEVEEGAKGE